MLKSVLDKKVCAECRWCCGFDSTDIWELPMIERSVAERLKSSACPIKQINGAYTFDLPCKENEISLCPVLDKSKGCTLSNADKPFDCKIWPLRVMKDGDDNVIAVCDSCPALKDNTQELIALLKTGLYQQIKDYVKNNPASIKPYDKDYTVLMQLK